MTQAITNDLEFRNFNQMMNRYRFQEAIGLFSDRKYNQYSVLSIAMDSGFGSIEPFNRAFKEQVGMTPREFRNEQNSEQMVESTRSELTMEIGDVSSGNIHTVSPRVYGNLYC